MNRIMKHTSKLGTSRRQDHEIVLDDAWRRGASLVATLAVIATGFCSGAGAALARSTTFEIIARTGDPVPGVAGGTFGLMGYPVINGPGRVAFNANVNVNGAWQGHRGLWSNFGGGLQKVVVSGDAVPSSFPLSNWPLDTFSLGELSLDDTGLMTFSVGVPNSPASRWLISPSLPLQLLSADGLSIPQQDGSNITSLCNAPLLNNGAVGIGDSSHLWIGSAVGRSNRWSAGIRIPGIPQGSFVTGVGAVDSMNAFGQALVMTGYYAPNLFGDFRRAHCLVDASGMTLVSRDGAPLPGIGSDVNVIFRGAVADSGDIWLDGRFSDSTDWRVVRGRAGGTYQTMVSAGSVIPGAPPEGLLQPGGVGSYLSLSSAGHCVVAAGYHIPGVIQGSHGEGILLFFDTDDSMHFIAHIGQILPGTSGMARELNCYGITPNGRVLVRAVSDGSGEAFYWWDRAAGLRKIVGTGDAVTLSPGDSPRTVQYITHTYSYGAGAGRISSIADDGAVFLGLHFAENTDVMVLCREGGTVCRADVNQSGTVTLQDIFDFLNAYFSNNATADINGSGSVTQQDIFDFLAAYFAGC